MNGEPLGLVHGTMRQHDPRLLAVLVTREGTAAAGNGPCFSGTFRAESTLSSMARPRSGSPSGAWLTSTGTRITSTCVSLSVGGASVGYPWLASVSATSRVRLLVFPDASFNTLACDVPRSDNEIRRAVRERLREL